jgi:hypothetical protein
VKVGSRYGIQEVECGIEIEVRQQGRVRILRTWTCLKWNRTFLIGRLILGDLLLIQGLRLQRSGVSPLVEGR